MALYSAGKVGVDIVPDTDNFWKILNAELHSRHPEVTVDVNTKGVAKAQSQLDRLDGRTLTNVVKIEGDDSGLRKLRKEYERIQREWENKPVVSHFNIDDSSYGRDLDKLRNKNRKAASDVRKNWLDNTLGTLADIRQEQKKYEEEADKLYRKRDKLLAKLEDGSKRSAKETKSLNEELANTSRQILDIEKKYDHTFKAIDSKRDKDLFDAQNVALFRREMDEADGFVKNMQRNLKAARMESDKYKKSLDKTTKTHELLSKQLTVTGKKYLGLSGNASDASRTMAKQQATARELTSLFDEQEAQVKALSAAFQKFKPMGIDKNLGKELNTALDQLKKLRDFASRKPITAKATLDKTQWDRKYAELMYDAEKLRAKLDRDHEVNVRVKVWEDNADKLEKRLNCLRHTRLDIPVEWQVDQERIIASMRETAAKIKANPERRWELEADLDLQMHRAEEKLKKFEDEHDEFKMDVDLETALARAHLAYFTRPRTIDIFANFKGTDLGKIFSGMTSGATGLKGVQNQFDNLVNTFDKLDKVVPKWSMLGAGLTTLGAGLLNLGRTAGGVGVSLVSMTKAAMAAPGALIGIGAAFTVLKHAWGDKGETFNTQIDIASTKLAGLGDAMDEAFYGKARPAIRDLMNDVSGKLTPGITSIAEGEGLVVEGLTEVIRKSYEADELPRIFTKSREAIDNLNPGLQDLTRAFLGLGDQTSEYLPRMGSYISNIASKWADWVDTAGRTGEIIVAMEKAVEQGGYLKSSVFDLIGILEGTLGTLAKTENGIQGFSEALAKANKAVHTIRFQETLEAWSAGAQDAQDKMRNAFKDIGDAAYSLKDTTRAVFGDAGQIVGEAITGLSRVLQQSSGGIRDFSSGVRDGFSQVFDAVGDAGHMFSDLASMVGQLSRTFGGTFAASLRAASPLITALANGAEALSNLFSKLPEPIQAAMGLWATFGRAGKTAFTSLKTGILQNIQQTMQYQLMLKQLGLSADQASVKMGTLIKAMNQLRSGNYAGILSGAVTGINQMGAAAQASGTKLMTVGEAAKQSASGTLLLANASGKMTGSVETVGKSAAGAVGKFGGLKNAASGLIGVLGGPWGIAASAAFFGISAAMSDYASKAQATEEVSQSVASAMGDVEISANKAGNAVSNISTEISKAFSNKDYGETGLNWLNDFTYGFQTARESADLLGISTSDLTKIVQNGGSAYDNLIKNLQDAEAAGTSYNLSSQEAIPILDDNAKAAGKVANTVKSLNKDMRDRIKSTAEANGHDEKYVNTLMSLGNATDFMALKAKSAAEQQADYAKAGELVVQAQEKQRNAAIQLANTQSSYQKVLSSMGSAMEKVHELAKDSSDIWDAQAESFNFTKEAGRTASDALSNLATSANDYLDAMIDSGAPVDKVIEQQKKLSGDLSNTANQLTGNAEGASDYANSLLMTPKEIKTQVELNAQTAKNTLLEYVKLLGSSFPNTKNGQAVFDMLIKLSASGAITTMDEVNAKKKELFDGLKDGSLVIAVDANGERAVMTLQDVQRLGGELQKDGSYKIGISADDAASPKIHGIIDLLYKSGLNGDQITMFLNAEGNANLKLSDVKNLLKELGVSDTDIDVYLNSHGNAPEQMEIVKQKLSELGFTPKDIEWILSAIDQTLAGTSSAQQNIDNVQQHGPAHVGATDDTKPPTDSAKSNIDSVKDKSVDVTATPYGLAGVQSLASEIRNLSSKEVTVTTTFVRNFIDNYMKKDKGWDGVYNFGGGHATGGRIYGPGTSTSDSIPAWLSDGEMVIKASSVRKLDAKYGRNFLNLLNSAGDIPAKASMPAESALAARSRAYAYAAGGRVRASNGFTVNVNPTIKVELSDGKSGGDTYVTQNFDQKIVRPPDDMYVAASIMYRNAAQMVGRISR